MNSRTYMLNLDKNERILSDTLQDIAEELGGMTMRSQVEQMVLPNGEWKVMGNGDALRLLEDTFSPNILDYVSDRQGEVRITYPPHGVRAFFHKLIERA